MSDRLARSSGGFAPEARIGGYLLTEQVGHGGTAVVFRAVDERLARPVALKILAPGVTALVAHLNKPATPVTSGHSAPNRSHHASASANTSPPFFTTSLENVWVAQLAAVSFSAGRARLDSELRTIRQQVPDAQVVSSSDYGSLTAGYWMIIYSGSFVDGTRVLTYGDSIGRTTREQCFGTFLSHDSAYLRTRCYPDTPTTSSCYFRP